MPAEWERHARCWMAWPDRPDLWGENLADTQQAYARVARAIARYEPVTMIACPESVSEAARICGAGVDTLALPIDDAWLRDTGPAFLVRDDGARAASAWHFNAWGGKFSRFEQDAMLAGRLCEHLDLPLHQADLRFEGGAISVDGEGTILTTESCALHPSRNPGMSRHSVERELCEALGGEKVIWLPGELSVGDCTDGHIDGLACFAKPGLVLLESLTEPDSERAKVLRENRLALRGVTDTRGRKLEIVEIEDAWEANPESDTFCISYINFYVANGGIVMPAYDAPGDEPARRILERTFPDHEIVQVDVRKIAIGGGGIHCITQQQPA